MNVSETAPDLHTDTASDSSNRDSTTAETKLRTVGRPFRAGPDERRNTAGRPPKGETFADKYRKQVERDADELIAKHVKRAKGDGVVSSKEFALIAAYAMGRPVQPYANVNGETVADDLDRILLANMGNREAVEGEYVVQPQAETG